MMGLHKRLNLLVTFFLIFIVIEGCDKSESRSSQRSEFSEPRTQVDMYDFTVKPGMDMLKLNLHLETEDGEMDWILTDPSGENKLDGRLEGKDSYKKVQLFKPVEGKWRLKVSTQEATGEVEVKWLAD